MASYTWLKRRGKTWHLHYAKSALHYAPNGQKSRSLNTTKESDAKEVQRGIESEIWACENGLKRKTFERLPYSEVVTRFIEHKKAAAICPGSLSTYKRTLNAFGLFMQTDLFVNDITPEHIEKYIMHRRTSLRHCDTIKPTGKLLKPKSIRNEAGMLSSFFKWLTDRDLLAENPMKRVSMPKRVVYDNQRALTPEEYLSLKSHIGENYRDILDVYLLTGLRRSDGLKLTSESFDFETMTATFFQSKTQRHKTLPISGELAQVVRRLVDRVGIGRPLIQVKASALTVAFRKARIRAGLPESITFHSLRHSFASWLAQSGVDFKTLQSLTGHASSQALEIYLHSFEPNRRTAIEKLVLPKVANG